MANSYVEYSVSGTGTNQLGQTTFAIPFNYISISDVGVKGYNGSVWSDLTVSSTDNTNKTVTLNTNPSSYQKIRVWRNTSSAQLVDFQNGSRLSETDMDTAYQQGLFVAQEVSENASTGALAKGERGEQGIQGIQGPAGQDGQNGQDGQDASDILTSSFQSSDLTFSSLNSSQANNLPMEVAHGLGAVPKMFSVSFKCVSAVYGWNVGDEVLVTTCTSTYGKNISVWATSTHIGVSLPHGFSLPYKNSDSRFATTGTNIPAWRLIFRAFA